MKDVSIDLWYGDRMFSGRCGTPQKLYTVLGRVSPASGVKLTARLNGGMRRPVAVGPSIERVLAAGDFLVEFPVARLRRGSNRLELVAEAGGRSARREVVIERDPDGHAPLPLDIRWDDECRLSQYAQPIDGRWVRDGDGVRPAEIGYDRLMAVGDVTWSGYEVTVPITLNRLAPLETTHPKGIGHLFGVLMNWIGHYQLPSMIDPRRRHKVMLKEMVQRPLRTLGLKPPAFPKAFWLPQGALFSYHWSEARKCHALRIESGQTGMPLVEDESGYTIEPGTTHVFRCRSVVGASGLNRHSFKVWPAGSQEPGRWLLECDGLRGELHAGCALLLTHFSDVTYGPIVVRKAE